MQQRTGLRPDIPLSLMEVEPKPISSPARMIGVNFHVCGRECQRESKGGGNVGIAILCLISLIAAIDRSHFDGGVTSVIRGVEAIRPPTRSRSGVAVESGKAILVLENDNRRRLVAKTTLERYGYSVALADNDSEMLAIFRKFASRIELVILDQTALRHATHDVIGRLQSIRPDIRILVSPPPADRRRAGFALAGWVPEPFGAPPLAEAVRKALSGSSLVMLNDGQRIAPYRWRKQR